MNIKIICFEEEKVEFEHSYTGFQCIGNYMIDTNYKSKYYRIENNSIEIIYLERKNINYKNYNFSDLKESCNIVLTLIREVNEENIDVINKIYIDTNSIIAIGKINLFIKESNKKLSFFNNKINLNKLINQEKINLNLLVMMLLNNDILNSIKQSKENLSVIIENNKSIGNIVMSILKQFNYIQNKNEYNFYLYSKEEVTLQELAYLEDPVREYIDDDNILTIINLFGEINNDDEYKLILISK